MIKFNGNLRFYLISGVTLSIVIITLLGFFLNKKSNLVTDKVSNSAKADHLIKTSNVDKTESAGIPKTIESLDDKQTEIQLISTVVSEYKSLEKVGSPKARLKMSLLIDNCGFGKDFFSSEEQIDKLEILGTSQDLVQSVRDKFSKCKGLFEYLGSDVNYRELSSEWLEDAAISGNAVAELLSLYRYPDPPDQEEVKPALYKALAYAQNNKALKGVVYQRAWMFHLGSDTVLNAPEPDPYADDFSRGLTQNSWFFLYCQYDENCDFAAESEAYLIHLYPIEYEEILAAAKALEKAIENQEWEKTGLN